MCKIVAKFLSRDGLVESLLCMIDTGNEMGCVGKEFVWLNINGEFGVLCCLTTPGLRKDIRRQGLMGKENKWSLVNVSSNYYCFSKKLVCTNTNCILKGQAFYFNSFVTV